MGERTARGSKSGDGRTPGTTALVPVLALPPNGKTLVPPRQKPPGYHDDSVFHQVFKSIVGGKTTFMQMARLAPLLDAKLEAFVAEYDNLSNKGKKKVKLTAICHALDIDPLHLMGVVSEAAMKYRDNASILIAALNMPKIVDRSVKEAMKPDGIEDRRMLFAHSGFVPTSKGTNISVLNQVAAKAQAANLQSENTLESFEKTVHAADEVMHEKD